MRKSVYGFELPGNLSAIMELFEALSFDMGSYLFPSWTCIGRLTTRLAFSGLWPIVLMGLAALCLFSLDAARTGASSFPTARRHSIEVAILISFCVLPSVTRSQVAAAQTSSHLLAHRYLADLVCKTPVRRLFLAFQCESFVYDDFAVGENGEPAPKSKLYLAASLDVECHAYLEPGGSTDHVPILVTAWAFIVLWPLAMPLMYVVLLFRCRTAVQNHQPSSLSRATRFLWSEYKDDYYWYEMVELTTKLLLTNFLLFVNFESGSDKFLRLFIGLLIAIFAFTMQLVLRPFRRASDDAIASVVRLLQVLFFVLGIMVKLCETEGPLAIHRVLDAKVKDSCGTLVGAATSYSVSVLILFAGLMAVLVPLGMLFQQLAFSRNVPILRVASTMEPPVVLLRKGEHYHLFLCATHPKSCPALQCHHRPTMPPIPSAGATCGALVKISAPSSSGSSSY